MKYKNCSRNLILAGCATILSFTVGVSAKEAGPYMHVGVTYWNDLEAPELDLEGSGLDVTVNPLEYEVDGSRAKASVGVGYNLDEQWGFEAFYVATPERVLSITNLVIPEIGIDAINSVSWRTAVKHTIFGVNAVFDVYLNENLSLFGKLGIASARHTVEGSISFAGLVTPIGDNAPGLTFVEEEDSTDLFGAIGARIPFRAGDASVTIAYQFVETSDSRESSFEVGVQWNF